MLGRRAEVTYLLAHQNGNFILNLSRQLALVGLILVIITALSVCLTVRAKGLQKSCSGQVVSHKQ